MDRGSIWRKRICFYKGSLAIVAEELIELKGKES
jgi:hypothetical protein